jgi:glycosyltransferase involved in cell wall biosynthesis
MGPVVVKILASAAYAAFLLVAHAACLWRRVLLGSWEGQARRRLERANGGGLRVLAMGTFYHRNWYLSHLRPVAQAGAIRRVCVVSSEAGRPIPGVTWCVPPSWMQQFLGRHASRAVWSFVTALRQRPDLIIGYFICPNALWALVLGKMFGAASCYQMCAGPREITRNGADSGNPLLRHVLPSLPMLHSLLFKAVREFDLLVVRGANAKAFCEQHFPTTMVRILPGSVDPQRFRLERDGERRYDVVTVCRLTPIKRLDVVLKALSVVVQHRPDSRSVIVGDGPELVSLKRLAKRLGLSQQVEFAGRQEEVERFHRMSRVFVLASDDEGLSIALAEAMGSGLPAVVSHVGELGELVRDGRNGMLVPPGDVASFGAAIRKLLENEKLWRTYADHAARDAYELCATPRVARRWTEVLTELCAVQADGAKALS